MTTTAAGGVSLAYENLKATLAASESFQSFVGAGNASTAAKRIYLEDYPAPANGAEFTKLELQSRFPCAVIGLVSYETPKISVSNQAEVGEFSIDLHWDVPDSIGRNFSEVVIRLNNALGQIANELLALVSPPSAGYLDIQGAVVGAIASVQLPTRGEVEGEGVSGNIVVGSITVTFGSEAG